MTLVPGMRLGVYEVTDRLGAGGMGEVFRATDTRLKRDVALKVLPDRVAADGPRMARFRREAELLASLNHPNIAHVHGLEESSETVALVMELVEGDDLSTLIARGRLPVDDVLRIASQIAGALEAAHDRGIVHRDLKPGNVRLRPDGVVRVLDFGLARSVPTSSVEMPTVTASSPGDMISGTPAYMSPEQARGSETGRETDVWAFGVVLYEMLSGIAPFARASTADTLAAVLNETVDESKLPTTTPDSIRRLMRRCLERDPRRRWRHIGDARLAVDDVLAAGLSSRDATAGEHVGPTVMTRRRALMYGSVSFALALTGLGAGALFGGRHGPAPVPSFQRLTFRRGLVRSARFAPDGETILYGALWDGENCRIHAVRINSPESQPIDLPPGNLLAISRSGELALALGPHRSGLITYGTLARVPMTGGTPRQVLENVKFADWSPDGSDLAIVRRVDGRDRLEFPIGNVLFAPTASEHHGIGFPRIAPDGRSVAFLHYLTPDTIAGYAAMIDQAGKVRRLSEDSLNIHGLTWRENAILYTSADDRPLFRTLREVTPGGTSRTVTRAPANLTVWDALPDGRVLAAQTDDRGVLHLVSNDAQRYLPWLDASMVDDLSRDGTTILFTEYGQGGGAASSVYLRRADGSPPVRLSAGVGMALSPDGRWAICRPSFEPSPVLQLIPTGPGESRKVEGHGLLFTSARWLPDGRRIVATGLNADRQHGVFVLDVDHGAPTAITPGGIRYWALSPDGSAVAAKARDGSIRIYRLGDSTGREVPGLTGHEVPLDWIADGLLVARPADTTSPPGQIYLLDIDTGRQVPWKNILLQDPAGIMHLNSIRATPDGRSYAYGWHLALSNLYLAAGLV